MKKLFVLIGFTAIFGCNIEDQPEQNLLKNSSKIIVDDDLYSRASNDAIQIINAVVIDDSLSVTFQYSGGCGNIYYDLISNKDFLETDPVQKNLRLAFKDEDDCEAGVEITLSFSIKETQISQENSIILNLQGWEQPLVYTY